MKAAVVHTYDAPLRIEGLPVPAPGSRDVLVRVKACGVCGSDLLLVKGGFASTLPIVPGHEPSGEVVEVGPEVEKFHPGDRVAIYYLHHCGECRYCRMGRINICQNVRRMGVDINGAFAEFVRVPEANLIPLPDSVPYVEGAVLTDAVATPYHALKDIARLQPGEILAVFGVGGIGSNAIQIGKLLGAQVIAVSRSDRKLELASRLGADYLLRAAGELSCAKLRELTGGYGADIAVQCVGSSEVDLQAMASVRKGGRVVFVGGAQKPFQARALDFIWQELVVMGSRGFTKQNVQDVIGLYVNGQLNLDHLVHDRLPLESINLALERLQRSDAIRIVLTAECD